MRGMLVSVAQPQTLTRISTDLNFTGQIDLHFCVLAAGTMNGSYVPLLSQVVPATGSGTRETYHSQPIRLTLEPGVFYAVGAAWADAVGYFWDVPVAYPQSWDHGIIHAGFGLATPPPYAGLQPAGLTSTVAYQTAVCVEAEPVAACPADIMPAPGGDGQVTIADIVSFISAFGSACDNCPQDISPPPNGDGQVSIADIASALGAFGLCDSARVP